MDGQDDNVRKLRELSNEQSEELRSLRNVIDEARRSTQAAQRDMQDAESRAAQFERDQRAFNERGKKLTGQLEKVDLEALQKSVQGVEDAISDANTALEDKQARYNRVLERQARINTEVQSSKEVLEKLQDKVKEIDTNYQRAFGLFDKAKTPSAASVYDKIEQLSSIDARNIANVTELLVRMSRAENCINVNHPGCLQSARPVPTQPGGPAQPVPQQQRVQALAEQLRVVMQNNLATGAQFEKTLERLKAETEEFEDKLEKLKLRRAEVKRRRDQLVQDNAQVGTLEQDVKQVSEQSKKLRDTAVATETSARRTATRIATIDSSVKSSRDQLTQAETTLGEAEQTLQQTTTRADQLQQRVSDLSNNASSTSSSVSSTRQTLAEIEASVKSNAEVAESLETRLEETAETSVRASVLSEATRALAERVGVPASDDNDNASQLRQISDNFGRLSDQVAEMQEDTRKNAAQISATERRLKRNRRAATADRIKQNKARRSRIKDSAARARRQEQQAERLRELEQQNVVSGEQAVENANKAVDTAEDRDNELETQMYSLAEREAALGAQRERVVERARQLVSQSLEGEAQTQRDQVVEQLNAEVRELDGQLTALTREREEARAQAEEAEAQRQQSIIQRDNLQIADDDNEQQLDVAEQVEEAAEQQAVEVAEQVVEVANTSVEELRNQIAALAQSLQEDRDRATQLRQEITRLSEQQADKVEEVNAIDVSLDSLGQALQQALQSGDEQAEARAQQEILIQNQNREQAVADLSQIQSEGRAKQAELVVTNGDITESEEQLQQLNSALQEAEQDQTEARQEARDTQQQYSEQAAERAERRRLRKRKTTSRPDTDIEGTVIDLQDDVEFRAGTYDAYFNNIKGIYDELKRQWDLMVSANEFGNVAMEVFPALDNDAPIVNIKEALRVIVNALNAGGSLVDQIEDYADDQERDDFAQLRQELENAARPLVSGNLSAALRSICNALEALDNLLDKLFDTGRADTIGSQRPQLQKDRCDEPKLEKTSRRRRTVESKLDFHVKLLAAEASLCLIDKKI